VATWTLLRHAKCTLFPMLRKLLSRHLWFALGSTPRPLNWETKHNQASARCRRPRLARDYAALELAARHTHCFACPTFTPPYPIREHPDDYDPDFEDVFVKLIDRLDPPPAT
jgi:hypothetical protein